MNTKVTQEEYDKALTIVEQFKEQEKKDKLKLFKESDVINNMFEDSTNYSTELLSEVDNYIEQDVSLDDLINTILLVASRERAKYGVSEVDYRLKSIFYDIFKKYPDLDSNIINNSNLSYFNETYISICKNSKLFDKLESKTILNIRNKLGSNLPPSCQILYLQMYVKTIRKAKKSLLIELGDRYIDENAAFVKAFENV